MIIKNSQTPINIKNLPYRKGDSSSLTFKGTLEKTTVADIYKPNIVASHLIHDTYFFRDFKDLQFINEYLHSHKPDGAFIADFGCSDGTEAYSLAMLLANPSGDDGFDPDKRYKIVGYDISDKIIDRAKKGITSVYKERRPDTFLLNNQYLSSEKQNKLKKLFNFFFKELNLSHKVKIEKLHSYGYLVLKNVAGKDVEEKFYRFKKELFGDSVSFALGNISDIGTNKLPFKNKKPDVIIFKNAWYHLTGNSNKKESDWKTKLDLVDKTIKNIHESIENDGILVVGSLYRDHLFLQKVIDKKNKTLGQNIKNAIKAVFIPTPENRGVIIPSPFHEVLIRNGFKPIKSSIKKSEYSSDFSSFIINVPSIWQKTTIPKDQAEIDERINQLIKMIDSTAE